MNLNDLLDNLVEEGVGEVLPDLRLDVPVRRDIGDVGSIGGASTSIDHPEDTAVPVEDNRARVPEGGERTVRVAIGEDSNLHRCLLDTILIDSASERLHSCDPTDGGTRRQTVLDDKKTLFSVRIKLFGVVDFVRLDDAGCLEKTILRVLVVGQVLRLGEHNLAPVQPREVAPCRGI
jgi:hypothetical protein